MADIDVVISGGSVEGLCTSIGFLKALILDQKHKIISAAGNSAGGVILGLHASGLDIQTIEDVIVNTDFSKYVSIPQWWNISKIIKFFRHGWLSDGEDFLELLTNLTQNKKFEDISLDLHLAGSNFSKYVLEDLNKSTEPKMPLALAMRITSCLPIGFKPVVYKNSIWYDGGIRRHYPVDLVPYSDRPFYGWLLGALTPGVPTPIDTRPGLIGILSDSVDQTVDNNVQDAMKLAPRKPITTSYDDVYVGTFDFNISRGEKIRLIEVARQLTLLTTRKI